MRDALVLRGSRYRRPRRRLFRAAVLLAGEGLLQGLEGGPAAAVRRAPPAVAGPRRSGTAGHDGGPGRRRRRRRSPPFRFIEEHSSGSQPCVSVHDANGRRWRVKWGHEVQPETLAVRLAWACGYFAEVTHFVPSGTIDGAGTLTRARLVSRQGRLLRRRAVRARRSGRREAVRGAQLVLDRQPVRRHAASSPG